MVLQRLQKLFWTGHHPLVELREYIVSEKFIWDDLVLRGEEAVKKVRDQWRHSKTVQRALIAWPAEYVVADNGTLVRDVVSLAIPEGMPTFNAAVELAKVAKAYALLLVERIGDDVRVILESHHGTRSWKMPIRRHGDVTVLEKEEAATDSESIGVLWRPRSTPT